MLARPPEEISLLEVIEAVEGPISLVPCMRGPKQCSHEEDCSFKPVCESLQHTMTGQLDNTTFADLTSGTYVEMRVAD
jgi:Rrf2 family protein